MTVEDRKRVCNDLKAKSPSTQLLYITPEQAATSNFQVTFLLSRMFISTDCFVCNQGYSGTPSGIDVGVTPIGNLPAENNTSIT